jgi:RHS repeat-associated protein
VLRGLIQTREGMPLPGVKITVHQQPQFGSTASQADGTFDLVVNGGGSLCVAYQKEGYLPACRELTVPLQDYAWLPHLVTVPLDSQPTAIDLGPRAPIRVIQGSPVKDADGERQTTLLLPQGTEATAVFPDGTRKPLASLKVRATEYTVGAQGPAAMPAGLPDNSAYTYAVEFHDDEAAAAGLKDVRFSKPLIHYVENFLKFPVGTIVPVGYFDREKMAWVASDNGRVVKVLAVRGGLADLDVDGNGNVADAKTLADMAVTEAERRQVAALYKPGQSLWRAPIPHFSTWDLNWGWSPPKDADKPGQPEPEGDDHHQDSDCGCGSIVDFQNQALGEVVGVAGTPFRLHYHSGRVPGRRAARSLTIPLSGERVPASLRRIELEIMVAGQRLTQTFPAQPQQRHTFAWDGKDTYGRIVQGQQPVTIRIGYVYGGVYEQTPKFGYSSNGLLITGSQTRQEVTIWQERKKMISGWDARNQGLGGWSLSVHHAYDPVGRMLYQGDGRQRSSHTASQIITTVAGNGTPGYSGDGGPASKAHLKNASWFSLAPDGSLYVADQGNHRVRRVGADGIITTVAGTGTQGKGGDGGPATKAQLNSPGLCHLGATDGSLYIADYDNNVMNLRRVGPDGVITTVPGGASGQAGVLRTSSHLYRFEPSQHRIVRIDPEGTYPTVAGNGTQGYSGDGGPATKAQLNAPTGGARGPGSSLYIADTGNHRIRRLGADGIITTIAGSGRKGHSGDGGPATKAELDGPRDVILRPDGSMYIADTGNHRIRLVSPDGIITTVVGSGEPGYSGDGGPATKAQLNEPEFLKVGPDGSLYIMDWGSQTIRRVVSPWSGVSTNEIAIPDEGGGQIYIFDPAGRHLRTVDAVTGVLLYRFEYDDAKRLTGIRDRDGNLTRIERDAQGSPTAIVAPFGLRTGLKLNPEGYLERVEPAGTGPTHCTYWDGGLLRALMDARENSHSFRYDEIGRLVKDEDPAEGFTAMERTNTAKGFEVAATTALKPATTYRVETLPTGEESRLNTCCCGAQTKTVIGTDGSRKVALPDGTALSEEQQPDPRWGMQAPYLKTLSLTTPRGRTFTLSAQRQVTLKQATNPLSLLTQTERVTVNGRQYTTIIDVPKNLVRTSTPGGRETVTTLDDQGRVKTRQVGNLYPVRYDYDDKHRLKGIASGPEKEERGIWFKYDAQGRLERLTDPLNRTVRFTEYDDAGRVKKAVLPGNREIGFDYYPDGSLKSITPPGRPAHRFEYTPVNRLKSYQPPSAGLKEKDTGYEYNKDRQLTKVTRPDGSTIALDYDKMGRLDAVSLPGNRIKIGFDPKTDQLKTLTTSDGETLTLDYDGFLVERTVWEGIVKGEVSYSYTKDMRLESLKGNGGAPIEFTYDDADGLLTRAGALTLKPDPKTGLLRETSLGKVSTSQEYNDFGEVKSFRASFGDKVIMDVQYTERDKLGRIHTKVETIDGETSTYTYDYDDAGRLRDVAKNGTKVGHYEYDGNANRTLYENANGKVKGEPDEQDRPIHYGDATYGYTANGEWSTKTVNGKTTSYGYDALGNLRTASLPDGTKIEYVIDGLNQRIGKKVNGKLVQGFLWQGRLRPVAELDGENKVVSRFVYAGGINVPDYMEKAGKTYRLIKDHLGSPRLMIDGATGQVAQRIDYDEFGKVLRDSNPGFQPFGFAGGLYDRDTQLVRFGARDYDAETGRWTTTDPIGFRSGATNLNAYVFNDPVDSRDLTGLWGIPTWGDAVNWGRKWTGIITVVVGVMGGDFDPTRHHDPVPITPTTGVTAVGTKKVEDDQPDTNEDDASDGSNKYCGRPDAPIGTTFDIDALAKATGLTGTALILYLIASEGSRVAFPPRNFVPIP